MKVLIVGGGGREHALAWKCAAVAARAAGLSSRPATPARHLEPKVQQCRIARRRYRRRCCEFAVREDIDLTIIGPEGPLVAGIVDLFAAAGRRMLRAVAVPRRAWKDPSRSARIS